MLFRFSNYILKFLFVYIKKYRAFSILDFTDIYILIIQIKYIFKYIFNFFKYVQK